MTIVHFLEIIRVIEPPPTLVQQKRPGLTLVVVVEYIFYCGLQHVNQWLRIRS